MLFRNTIEDTNDCISLKIEGWITPNDDKERDYSKEIKKLERELKQISYEFQSRIGYSEYIVDLDLRESGISYGKKSYLKCHFTFKKENHEISLDEYLNLINEYFDSHQIFKMSQEKK
jgi:hypothetical protein